VLLGSEPSDWCHALVVSLKLQGGVQMCPDLCMLNCNDKRSVYLLIIPVDAVSCIQGSSKYITYNDTTKGY